MAFILACAALKRRIWAASGTILRLGRAVEDELRAGPHN
jgi:hypothetical protein